MRVWGTISDSKGRRTPPTFFFSSRRRHTRFKCDWSSDVCSSDLPRGRRWHLLMHVCVQAGSAIGKCCASGNDVDVPLLYQFLRPGRFQLRQVARCFAALGAAAEAQPRRIDADTADADRFANPIAADELWPGGDIALDLRVEAVADVAETTPGAAQGDRLVQWQDFPKHL